MEDVEALAFRVFGRAKVDDVGEAGEDSKRENGLRKAGYPAPPICFASSVGTGGMGTEAEAEDLNAFFSEASEPFRLARNPVVEEMEVPGVTKDEDEPLLNFPSLGLSGGLSSSCPNP